jgi:glycine cleavage system H protein
LVDQPQAVNDDPYAAGWMIRIRADDPAQLDNLLTAQQYADETGEA